MIKVSAIIGFRDVDVTAYPACEGRDGLEVLAETSLTFTSLPGHQGRFLREVQSAAGDPVNVNLMQMVALGSSDIAYRAWSAFLATNRTGLVTMSFTAVNEFCPASIGMVNTTLPPSSCAMGVPRFKITALNAVNASLDLMQQSSRDPPTVDPQFALDDTFGPPILNMLQLSLAAFRIDLGNPSPNNFLTYPEALNRTLAPVFPSVPLSPSMPSQLYDHLHQQSLLFQSGSASAFDAFRIPGPSIVQTVYVCKLLKRKDAANLIVSVFVATAGMFTTGWALFISIARCLHRVPGRDDEVVEQCRCGIRMQELRHRSWRDPEALPRCRSL
ncbi:hypothetical protein NMY22_g10384 [Coprinellus aureogranulatus]|nr:hypothetical protein NMY22_g10384 [Coprinellus aureogranulatus]